MEVFSFRLRNPWGRRGTFAGHEEQVWPWAFDDHTRWTAHQRAQLAQNPHAGGPLPGRDDGSFFLPFEAFVQVIRDVMQTKV